MGVWTQAGVQVAKLFGLGVLAAEVADLKEEVAKAKRREDKLLKAVSDLTNKLTRVTTDLDLAKELLGRRDEEIADLKDRVNVAEVRAGLPPVPNSPFEENVP
jgi:predicted  nucleic acid-binding Zn-ribbon protein